MKRDMELIRKILFYIEENYVAGDGHINIEIDGYSESEIYEHCQLAHEAGLIQQPLDAFSFDGPSCFVGNLTNAGFDYLEAIRDDTRWNRTKEAIKKKGLPLIIDTIKTIATALVTAAAEGVANSILKNGGQI